MTNTVPSWRAKDYVCSMNEQQALSLLEWNLLLSPDEQQEWEEEWIFDRSKEVLQKAYAPVLIQKRIDEMTRVLEALSALGFFSEKKDSPSISWDANDGLSFLRSYEKNRAIAKTAIAQSRSVQELHSAALLLKEVTVHYMNELELFFPEIKASTDAVKSQDELDTARVIMALKNGEMNDEIAALLSKEKARIALLRSL